MSERATVEHRNDWWYVRYADATVGKYRTRYQAYQQADDINLKITESEQDNG